MKKEILAYLIGYMKNQREEIIKLLNKIEQIEPEDEPQTVYVGYLIHNLYCVFEDIFKEIAKTFENQIDDTSKYHRALLKRMTIEIPYIRPSVVSNESFLLLDEMRSFRHVFRHAYTYELDKVKIKHLKTKILSGIKLILLDIDTFENFLKNLLEKEL